MEAKRLVRWVAIGLLLASCGVIALWGRQPNETDSCADAAAFEDVLRVPGSHAIDKLNDKPDKDPFFKAKGRLSIDPAYTFFTMARGWNASRAWTNWLLHARLPLGLDSEWGETLTVDGEDFQVFWASDQHFDRVALSARILFLGNEPVDHLIQSQARDALHQLRHGTSPYTLAIVEAYHRDRDLPRFKKSLEAWLADFVRHQRKHCRRL